MIRGFFFPRSALHKRVLISFFILSYPFHLIIVNGYVTIRGIFLKRKRYEEEERQVLYKNV